MVHVSKSNRHINTISKQYSLESIQDYGRWRIHKLTLTDKEINLLTAVLFEYLSTEVCHKHSENFQTSVRNFACMLNKGVGDEILFGEDNTDKDKNDPVAKDHFKS